MAEKKQGTFRTTIGGQALIEYLSYYVKKEEG